MGISNALLLFVKGKEGYFMALNRNGNRPWNVLIRIKICKNCMRIFFVGLVYSGDFRIDKIQTVKCNMHVSR